MAWFGNGQGTRLADLEAEVSALRKRVVTAEQTVADVAERAYKWMKKAEARSRRELDESGAEAAPAQGPRGGRVAEATPSSSRRARGWGARGRWGRLRRSDPALELVPDEATGT